MVRTGCELPLLVQPYLPVIKINMNAHILKTPNVVIMRKVDPAYKP